MNASYAPALRHYAEFHRFVLFIYWLETEMMLRAERRIFITLIDSISIDLAEQARGKKQTQTIKMRKTIKFAYVTL